MPLPRSLPVTVQVSSWNVMLHSPLRTAETPPSATPPEDMNPNPMPEKRPHPGDR